MLKLLFIYLEEVKMFFVLIGLNESSICIFKIIGMLEIIFGVVWLLLIIKWKLFILYIIVLLVLMLVVGFMNIVSFIGLFNLIILNVFLMGLLIVGYINSFDLLSVKNCKRVRKG